MSVKPTSAAKPSLPPLSLSPTKGPAEKPKPSIGPLPDKKAKPAGAVGEQLLKKDQYSSSPKAPVAAADKGRAGSKKASKEELLGKKPGAPEKSEAAAKTGNATDVLGAPAEAAEGITGARAKGAESGARDAKALVKGAVEPKKPGQKPESNPEKARGKKGAQKFRARERKRVAAAAAEDAAHARKVAKGADLAGKGLDAIGAGATAVDQYKNSTAVTGVGKAVDAGLAAGVDLAFGKASPYGAAVDAGSSLITGKPGFSDHLNGSVHAVTTLGEAGVLGLGSLATGKPVDTSGLESFHERSKSGEWGTPLRKASEAGDFWAKSGIRGGLEEARREITPENLKNLVTD